jgi:hypothetical protein
VKNKMNVKNILCIVIGAIVFFGIWLYSMLSGLTLLIGFGSGILLFNWLKRIFKNLQDSIYLSEKADRQHRVIELESELSKIKKEVKE